MLLELCNLCMNPWGEKKTQPFNRDFVRLFFLRTTRGIATTGAGRSIGAQRPLQGIRAATKASTPCHALEWNCRGADLTSGTPLFGALHAFAALGILRNRNGRASGQVALLGASLCRPCIRRTKLNKKHGFEKTRKA